MNQVEQQKPRCRRTQESQNGANDNSERETAAVVKYVREYMQKIEDKAPLPLFENMCASFFWRPIEKLHLADAFDAEVARHDNGRHPECLISGEPRARSVCVRQAYKM